MKQQKGFTLVEAAVAIGIVAILSGIIIPLVMKNLNDAKIARARNDINVIVGAIAHQNKDTSTRPWQGPGPGGCDGTGDNAWISTAQAPVMAAAPNMPGPNSFTNLFTAAFPSTAGNDLFGILATTQEHGYRGPYLGTDSAIKADPWGRAYLILGYNANGQTSSGPIWVVTAGDSNTIEAVNTTLVVPPAGSPVGTPNVYPATWNYAGLSASNLAVRVN